MKSKSGTTVIMPKQKLNKAMNLLDSGDYDAAYALLEEIGNSDVIASSKYDRAVALIEAKDYEPAYILLNGLNYKDSKEKAISIYKQYRIELLKAASIGDTIYFGSYEQDNDTTNGKETIEWLVITKENNRILVISKEALDGKPYNNAYAEVTWETCSLRSWLNNDFYNNSFSDDEKALIIQSKLLNTNNSKYGSNGGKDTIDNVFILSDKEAKQYFSDNDARKAKASKYARQHTSYVTKKGYCYWWLRTPGENNGTAVRVGSTGGVGTSGDLVDSGVGVVRPAIWLSIEL